MRLAIAGAGVLVLALGAGTATSYATPAQDESAGLTPPRGVQSDTLVPAESAVTPEVIETAIDGGLAWLLESQMPTGAWGSHHSSRPIEVFCTVPGSHDAFRAATTALCVMAIADAGRLGGRSSEPQSAAFGRGVDYLVGNWDVKRVDALEHYTVWALGYALRCLSEQLLHGIDAEREPILRAACAELVVKLDRYQALDGGWGYLSLDGLKTFKPSWTSMSFTTATVLIGLARARDAGIDVPEAMLSKAATAIERCRMPSGAFTYGEIWNASPVAGINLEKGAACRTPACSYALTLAGRTIEQDEIERGLENLLVRHARFQVLGLRRPIPHESWYSISGYFYLYGYAYAARQLEEQSPELRARLAPELARAILVCRQPDGSFWDYPLYSYHKPYGTAYALLGLLRARPPAERD